jgi:hypothetical protein
MRFLMIKASETTADDSSSAEATDEEPLKINIIVNWFEELKDKMPVDRKGRFQDRQMDQ